MTPPQRLFLHPTSINLPHNVSRLDESNLLDFATRVRASREDKIPWLRLEDNHAILDPVLPLILLLLLLLRRSSFFASSTGAAQRRNEHFESVTKRKFELPSARTRRWGQHCGRSSSTKIRRGLVASTLPRPRKEACFTNCRKRLRRAIVLRFHPRAKRRERDRLSPTPGGGGGAAEG